MQDHASSYLCFSHGNLIDSLKLAKNGFGMIWPWPASMEVFPSWVVSAVTDGCKEFKSLASKILELKDFIHILQRFETRNLAPFFAITMKLVAVFSPSISCSVVHVAPRMSHSTASGISNWNLTHLAQLEACNVTWHHCVWHCSVTGPRPLASLKNHKKKHKEPKVDKMSIPKLTHVPHGHTGIPWYTPYLSYHVIRMASTFSRNRGLDPVATIIQPWTVDHRL